MDGIPPAEKTDNEDVVWALQTADALWKRGERGDAIVWLRRAAQAAGDAQDDDRALTLARFAAELSDKVGPIPSMAPEPPPARSERPSVPSVRSAAEAHAGMLDPWAEESRRTSGTNSDFPDEELDTQTLVQNMAHAIASPVQQSSGQIVDTSVAESIPPSSFEEMDDEVITSARTLEAVTGEVKIPPELAEKAPGEEPSENAPRRSAAPQPRSIEPRPAPVASVSGAPPLPPVASRKPPPPPPVRKPPPPPPVRKPPAPPAAAPVSARPAPVPVSTRPAAAPVSGRPAAAPVSGRPAPAPAKPPSLDLSQLEAFSDLPDDARDEFARAAEIHELKKDEETSGFALAVVVEGEVDVAATIVDAAAERLKPYAVLRAQGSIGEGLPLRLVAASVHAKVATWNAEAVEQAFRTCPWVEDDLRAAANRTHAIVGITMGPLAERLDASIRKQITDRLDVRGLEPGQILVRRGEPMPGIVLVGVGSIEVVGDDEKTVEGNVSPGEFLFSTSVFGGAAAPATARASAEGAVLLMGNRTVAQELLVTCPPLLEVLAGM